LYLSNWNIHRGAGRAAQVSVGKIMYRSVHLLPIYTFIAVGSAAALLAVLELNVLLQELSAWTGLSSLTTFLVSALACWVLWRAVCSPSDQSFRGPSLDENYMHYSRMEKRRLETFRNESTRTFFRFVFMRVRMTFGFLRDRLHTRNRKNDQ
jgi:ABC-type nickel/cobalt efflux system permease component RcnA